MRFKLNLFIFIFLLILTPFVFANNEVDIYVFHGQGCPHCAQLLKFLDSIKDNYPSLNIVETEVYFDNEGRELFAKMCEAYGTEIQGVPTLFIDDKVIVGFSESLSRSLIQEIDFCIENGCESPILKLEDSSKLNETRVEVGDSSPSEDPKKTENVKKLTIPVVISAAAIDAINPCAFAVLILLLTTILASGFRKRALLAGLAFTISIYISYFLMGLGLYSAIQASGLSHGFFKVVAILAILLGLFNLKDYLWYGKWFIMEVPLSWRPKMKTLLKGITSVPGAFLIGFVISLFLLPCTSGPYIVILGMLAKVTTKNYAIFLLLIYNLIFVLPMLLITSGIYFGFTTTEKAEEWRQSKLKHLHLIAGIIILLLGIAMLIGLKFGWI